MPNAIFFYHIGRWLYLKRIPFIPKLIQLIIFLLYNCRVPVTADIGKGSFLVVKGIGVSLHNNTIIGDNCRIGIGCKTVGKAPYKKVPEIKNNVFIGPGAVLVGPIIIEDNVIIAPNAVVTKSVPKNSIVGGVPAKILGCVDDLQYGILNNESFLDDIAPYMTTNKG